MIQLDTGLESEGIMIRMKAFKINNLFDSQLIHCFVSFERGFDDVYNHRPTVPERTFATSAHNNFCFPTN